MTCPHPTEGHDITDEDVALTSYRCAEEVLRRLIDPHDITIDDITVIVSKHMEMLLDGVDRAVGGSEWDQ